MILGVHRKASRLAVLGELGRYPLFITAMSQLLKYRISLDQRPSSLVGQALTEMSSMTSKGQDCWLNRVDTIMNLLKINHSDHTLSKVASRKFSSSLKSKFDIFWKKKVNEIKHVNNDHLNHNKLRVYSTLKSSFKSEPYLEFVRNRNQRSALTRLRISAHSLATETGRRARPKIPYNQRFCTFCHTENFTLPNQTCTPDIRLVDSEAHFLIVCARFINTRSHFFNKLEQLIPGFKLMDENQKFLTILCPTNAQRSKLVNRYIKFMFEKRDKIEGGDKLYGL